MKGFDLVLTLKDDCVISERAATEGSHRGLDYIPGATLLGAAAAKLYRQYPEQAFVLFHSGRVRFGNGYPVADNGESSWSVPLSWHHAKGEKYKDGQTILGEHIWCGVPAEEHCQPTQIRSGYFTTSGVIVEPKKAHRLKTAIDPNTARAREAALFGYDALCAGQAFRARISLDADISDETLQVLKRALTGTLLLGRSRSAEYGRVESVAEAFTELPQGSTTTTKRISLWLLSDMAALDPWGQPTLSPAPQWLGLPDGELIVEQSYLRSRRYSPWNAKRGGPDLERQVISQGSVLVFDLSNPLDDIHRARIAAGLGMYREAGLGQVWLMAPILEGTRPQFTKRPVITEHADKSVPDLVKSPFIQWLEFQGKAQRTSHAADASIIAAKYREALRSARTLKGLDEGVRVGPSHSQWGRVLEVAKTGGVEFAKSLFDENNGPCKPKAPGWNEEYWDEHEHMTRNFAHWIRSTLGPRPDYRQVQHIVREVMDILKKETRT